MDKEKFDQWFYDQDFNDGLQEVIAFMLVNINENLIKLTKTIKEK
jgi:hypothetical protein